MQIFLPQFYIPLLNHTRNRLMIHRTLYFLNHSRCVTNKPTSLSTSQLNRLNIFNPSTLFYLWKISSTNPINSNRYRCKRLIISSLLSNYSRFLNSFLLIHHPKNPCYFSSNIFIMIRPVLRSQFHISFAHKFQKMVAYCTRLRHFSLMKLHKSCRASYTFSFYLW